MRSVTLAEQVTKRAYELPRNQYAFWYNVGERFGCKDQDIIAEVLGNGSHTISKYQLSTMIVTRKILEVMAAKYDVVLYFK